MHDFSAWLRTGSNPADSNRFQSHAGKEIKVLLSKIDLLKFLVSIFNELI